MSVVYFIKPIGFDGPIKIGCSLNPQLRQDQLQRWCPFPLEIIASLEGDIRLEHRFHALFRDQHVRHEWFNPSPEMLAVIERINAGAFETSELPEPKSLHSGNKGWVRTPEWRKQQGYTIRASKMQSRSGFASPVNVAGILERGDENAIALLEAYFAEPHVHGKALPYPWARQLQRQWLKKLLAKEPA